MSWLGDAWNWLGQRQGANRVGGLETGDYMRNFLQGGLGGLGGRQAPLIQGATLSPEQREWRRRQMALAGNLEGILSGQQKGAGEIGIERGIQRGLASQQALANMQRGAGAAAAARGAARTSADITGEGAGQIAQAKLMDQEAARQALNQLYSGARGQDIGVAGEQARLQQEAALANQVSQLRQMQLNDQQIVQYLSQLYNMDASELQARLQQMGTQTNAQMLGQLAGGVSGILGGLGIL